MNTSQDSAFCTAITLRAGRPKFDTPQTRRIVVSHTPTDRLWVSPSRLFNGYRRLLWG